MKLPVLVTIIVSSSAFFQHSTNDDLNKRNCDEDASITSAEIEAINDPKLKNKVIKGKQKVLDLKSALYTTISKSFFNSFGCAIESIRYDLELAFRRKLEDGTMGYDVGSQPLDDHDLRIEYPDFHQLNGVAQIRTNFPKVGDQERLTRYFLRWFKFTSKNETSPLALKVREELKKLCEAENRTVSDELYREFSFALSRSYLVSCTITHKLMRQLIQTRADRLARNEGEIAFEDGLAQETPGGWFFPKRHLVYLNLLRRCYDMRDGEYVGLEFNQDHVIPYTEADECPGIKQSNVLKILPSLLKNHLP